jgi:hypothetical protein
MPTIGSKDAIEIRSSEVMADWEWSVHGDGYHITTTTRGQWTKIATVHGMNPDIARLIAATPRLLALAYQYARECGDCAGARITPDDEPCTECIDVWAIIDNAKKRS